MQQTRMFDTGELKKIDKVEKGQIGEVYVVAKGELEYSAVLFDGCLFVRHPWPAV